MDTSPEGYQNIVVMGAGAIGQACMKQLSERYPQANIHGYSSRPMSSSPMDQIQYHRIQYTDEASIQDAIHMIQKSGPIDLTIVATGLLHTPDIKPEKALKELSMQSLHDQLHANCIVPAMLAKQLLPLMPRHKRSVFAALSARVGSISDNR